MHIIGFMVRLLQNLLFLISTNVITAPENMEAHGTDHLLTLLEIILQHCQCATRRKEKEPFSISHLLSVFSLFLVIRLTIVSQEKENHSDIICGCDVKNFVTALWLLFYIIDTADKKYFYFHLLYRR
jgi:hypothetical protein